MAGEKLAKLIKQQKPSAGSLTDLMYGVVTSTSPLKIRVDSRFEVGAAHLVLSQMVRRLVVRTSDVSRFFETSCQAIQCDCYAYLLGKNFMF